MRGSPCPEAWAFPVPEPVGPKVWAKPHQSYLFSPGEDEWKRGSTAQNPRGLSPGSFQYRPSCQIAFLVVVTFRARSRFTSRLSIAI